MTIVIFQGNYKEVSRKTMTDKAANDLLESIKSTDSFVVDKVSMQYTDSYLVIHESPVHYNELYVIGNEMEIYE